MQGYALPNLLVPQVITSSLCLSKWVKNLPTFYIEILYCEKFVYLPNTFWLARQHFLVVLKHFCSLLKHFVFALKHFMFVLKYFMLCSNILVFNVAISPAHKK